MFYADQKYIDENCSAGFSLPGRLAAKLAEKERPVNNQCLGCLPRRLPS